MAKALYYINWNFHKKLFSIRRGKEPRQYLDFIVLENCQFRIRKSGYEKFVREGVKNVHAFITAEKIHDRIRVAGNPIAIKYDPTKAPYFYDGATKEPIQSVIKYIVCRVVEGRAIMLGYLNNDNGPKRNLSSNLQIKEKV